MRKQFCAVIALCIILFNMNLYGQGGHVEEYSPTLILPIGHTNAINTVEFSPDDQYLVTSSYDKTCKVWSAKSGVELFTMYGHSATVNTACYSNSGKYIATSSNDGTARIWSGTTARQIHTLSSHKANVRSAKFSFDDQYIVTASFDSTARLWSVATGELLQILSGHNGKVVEAEFSSDGKQIVTASFDSTARVWSAVTGEEIYTLSGHTGPIKCARFSSDGKHIITASFDSTARVWSVATGEQLHTLSGHSGIVFEADFSPDKQFLVTASFDSTARVWSAVTGEEIYTLSGHTGPIKCARFNSGGKQIVTASLDKTIKIWSVATGNELNSLPEQNSAINSVDFSSNGENIVTAGMDGKARLWSLKNSGLLHTFEGYSGWISLQNISPDGKYIVTTEFDGSTKVWSVATGEERFNLTSHSAIVNNGEFSRDGQLLITAGGDKVARVWSMQTGEELFVLKGHTLNINSASFSHNGQFIITSSADGTAKVWSVETGEEIHTLKGHFGIVNTGAFSPDGQQLLTAGIDRTARIWSFRKGKEIHTLLGHSNKVTEAKFSPDGSLIVTLSNDGTLKVWSVDSGEEQYTLPDISSGIFVFKFSPDGRYLLTASSNGDVKVWSFVSGQEEFTLSQNSKNLKFVTYSPDGKQILTLSDENTIRIWNTSTGKEEFSLANQSFWLNQARYSPDGKLIITTGGNGSITFYDSESGEEIISKIVLKDNNWININPNGLFDASPKAMAWMHYSVGLEVIELEQLKERYYYPGLYKEQMLNGSVNLPDVTDFYSLEMYPKVDSRLRNDSLFIHLFERNGGIGKVSLFINGKEVVQDLNPDRRSSFSCDLKQFSKHFLYNTNPTINKISIRAFNQSGWLKSSFIEFEYITQPVKNNSGGIKFEINYSPKFYAVIVGTADYNGTALDLKYADKDAEYIYTSISQASKELFENNTSIFFLRTSTDSIAPRSKNDVILTASKSNIKSAFESISKRADPRDILFMYFAGHGVCYGGTENDQFYYLTKDCTTGEISDPVIRQNYTISTEEFTQWIGDIAARKQVMIIDACSSGKIIEDLTIQRDVPTSQIRALDRLKDRTGMFVITGSAAEKVSYESSQFGQGLLTYTLLEGMSGEALMNKQVDVSQLFNFARDKVPQYAEDLGASQKPILFSPQEASSFPIGLVNDSVNIPIEQVKPVFLRTILLNEDYGDPFNISQKMDDYLDAISYNFSHEIVFVDVKTRKNAYEIRGGYSVKPDNKISVSGRLYFNNEKIEKFSAKGSTENVEGLIESIMFEVSTIVNKHKNGLL